MAGAIFNELEELVANVCDNLYAQRRLITTNNVRNALLLCRELQEQELAELPIYINKWRLHNIHADSEEACLYTKVKLLETQLAQYQTDLQLATQMLSSLRAEIVQQRNDILQSLRDAAYGYD